MRIVAWLFTVACYISCGKSDTERALTMTESMDTAVIQYMAMDKTLPDTLFPRSTNKDGLLWTCESGWWTSGFYPGSLWYLYEYSDNPEVLSIARRRTDALLKEKDNLSDHDIGFKIFCSYGNAYRITLDTAYLPVMHDAANTLIKRFNPKVGCIRSWGRLDDMENPYLVIIDNMMNLELLFWASRYTDDSTYYNIAVTHADSTLKHHYRPDGSSYHVVEYDPNTGEVLRKRTAQGYADESSWARGQSWGLYGYVMAYMNTGLPRYLDHAKKIADYLLTHPNYPEDGVPYWDYNAPDIPNALRDASAGSIMASALFQLATVVEGKESDRYEDAAHKIIRTLSTPEYRASNGTNNNFLLNHGVGHLPEKSEVDVPLSYGDYYYLEAMVWAME